MRSEVESFVSMIEACVNKSRKKKGGRKPKGLMDKSIKEKKMIPVGGLRLPKVLKNMI
jgi:hypothetical protein